MNNFRYCFASCLEGEEEGFQKSIYQKNLLSITKKKHNRLTKIGGKVTGKKIKEKYY